MKLILHGENTVKSRQALVESIENHKAKGGVVERLVAKKLEPAEFESQLATTNLFQDNRLVIIEELHSLRRSKRKKRLIELAQIAEIPLILWEKRDLTKTMLKKFPQAKVQQFKITNQLFKWLDSLSPNQSTKADQIKIMRQAAENNDEFMCLAMLARQVRLLIQAKEDGKISAPPFVIAKLKRQAGQFKLEQLLKLHQNLLELDLKLKSSQNQMELGQHLEWLIYQL